MGASSICLITIHVVWTSALNGIVIVVVQKGMMSWILSIWVRLVVQLFVFSWS
jgi:hypothetical protein